MSKGTFNQGWWNCFESFAAEISRNNGDTQVITNVLIGAGITKREASYWIDHYNGPYYDVLEIVKKYWFSLR